MSEPRDTRIAALSQSLREGSSDHLERRRTIAKLLIFAGANLAVVALYQIGVLKKLPQPSWRGFDAQAVNGSPQAYSLLATPDAFLGLASYSTSACLVAAGSQTRWRANPLLPICMTAKLLADAAYAGKLTLDEMTKYRSFSIWSLSAAAATFAALPLALPECKAALKNLRGSGR